MMRAKTGYGRIINISSVSGIIGNPGQGNYAASKAGMIGMSKSLAREVASRGITVNCIAPGFISTPMTDVLNEKQVGTIKEAIPAQKFGTPADIAAACVYLASAEGRLHDRPDAARERRHGHDLSSRKHGLWATLAQRLSGAGQGR